MWGLQKPYNANSGARTLRWSPQTAQTFPMGAYLSGRLVALPMRSFSEITLLDPKYSQFARPSFYRVLFLIFVMSGEKSTKVINILLRAFSFVPGLLTKGEHPDLANCLGGVLASPTATQFARSQRQWKNSCVYPNFVMLLLPLPCALLCSVSERQHAILAVLFCFLKTSDFGFTFVR